MRRSTVPTRFFQCRWAAKPIISRRRSATLHKRAEVHRLAGHRWFLESGWSSAIIDDHREATPPGTLRARVRRRHKLILFDTVQCMFWHPFDRSALDQMSDQPA
jgi:hypothetical protein